MIVKHFIFVAIPWLKQYYSPIIKQEIEAQRGSVNFLRFHSLPMVELGLKPKQSVLFTTTSFVVF
jgi:hypothetical protein